MYSGHLSMCSLSNDLSSHNPWGAHVREDFRSMDRPEMRGFGVNTSKFPAQGQATKGQTVSLGGDGVDCMTLAPLQTARRERESRYLAIRRSAASAPIYPLRPRGSTREGGFPTTDRTEMRGLGVNTSKFPALRQVSSGKVRHSHFRESRHVDRPFLKRSIRPPRRIHKL